MKRFTLQLGHHPQLDLPLVQEVDRKECPWHTKPSKMPKRKGTRGRSGKGGTLRLTRSINKIKAMAMPLRQPNCPDIHPFSAVTMSLPRSSYSFMVGSHNSIARERSEQSRTKRSIVSSTTLGSAEAFSSLTDRAQESYPKRNIPGFIYQLKTS